MKISRITADGVGDLHSVMAACFQKGASDYWSAVDMKEIISLDHCYGYSAGKMEGETGIIVVRVIGEEAEILTLGVLPASRASTWFLDVRADNKAAIKLYESLGFEAVGKRPGYYRDAEGVLSDALTMRAKSCDAR